MSEIVGDTSYRAQLEEDVVLQALKVSPKQVVGKAITKLFGKIFAHRGVRYCMDDPTDEDAKIVLLDRTVDAATAQAEAASITNDAAIFAEAIKKAKGKTLAVQVVTQSVHLTYKNYTVPEILGKILPSNVVALSGFEQIGHIAHVNLSDSHLPFKFKIGQVILDCNPSIVRTVVNKVGTIDSVFREFKMEVIGGEHCLTAEVKQHGCVMRIPYDKVYWNSRLSQEHHRLVSKLKAGDELFDVMAGCGPFAIPAALKGVRVYANDLNPASVDAMKENAKLNNVPDSKLTCYNMDGRAFVDDIMRGGFMVKPRGPTVGKRHVTMNLPATAVEFLDVFTRASFREETVVDSNVTIHVYTFCSVTTSEEARADALAQVAKYLGLAAGGHALPEECIEEVTVVRDVAPKKLMVCVSFKLPLNEIIQHVPIVGAKRARSDE